MVVKGSWTSGLGSQVIRGRWFMLFASNLIMAMSGASYLFGLYSNDIKSSMGYDQATLNLVSFSQDLGINVGLFAILVNVIAAPWVVLAIGAVMNFFGYLMIWFTITGHLKNVAVWQMCVYFFIGANSITFINTGNMVTCVKNFPKSRGVVLGISTGYIGLSGAILVQFYHALYGNNSKALILLIAWLPTTIYIVFLRAIRIMKFERQQHEAKVFYNLLYISLSLAGFLMIMIILQNWLTFTRAEYIASAIGVLLLLILPLVSAIKEEYNLTKQSEGNSEINDEKDITSTTMVAIKTDEIQPPKIDAANADYKDQTHWMTNIFKPPKRGEDYTVLQALFSLDMQLLLLSLICGLGGFLTTINNLGQIGTSLGYPAKSISTFVSSVSIWNYLGRVISGVASEIVLAKYKLPRPLVMSLLLLVSCIAHLLIAFAIPNSLYIASVIIGFCFGALCPLGYSIISEIFGLKHFSVLFIFTALCNPIGTLIFNVTLTGSLYDKVALRQLNAKGLSRTKGEDLSCFGAECYKLAFLIMAATTFFGCLVSSILALRTKTFYRGDIYKKFREDSHAIEDRN